MQRSLGAWRDASAAWASRRRPTTFRARPRAHVLARRAAAPGAEARRVC